MARKTKSETDKTIASILDAAEVVFIREGVAHTTMADLAHEAGVSRGAVYGHYPDKIQVCIAMCARAMASSAAILESAAGENVIQTLQRWGLNYLRVVHSPGSIRNALEILYVKCEQSPEFGPLMEIRQAWEKRTHRATASLLKKALASAELPADLDLKLSNEYLQCLLAGISTSLWFGEKQNHACWLSVEKMLAAGIDTIQLSQRFRKQGTV